MEKDSTTSKVKTATDAATDLQELFENSLKDIYWAEKAMTKALPKMAQNATSEKLKSGINKHLEETMNQITR